MSNHLNKRGADRLDRAVQEHSRTSSHTPTPWEVGDDGIVTPYAGDRIIVQTGMDSIEADQDFIVRAVNAHDALIAALKGLVDACELTDDAYYSAIDAAVNNARAALALAEPH